MCEEYIYEDKTCVYLLCCRGCLFQQKVCKAVNSLIHFLKGAEEVNSVTALIGIANELGVKFLVTLQGNASFLLIIGVHELFKGVVELLDALVGHPLDAVAPVLIDTDGAVTININCSE